jgi:hypothetical protein
MSESDPRLWFIVVAGVVAVGCALTSGLRLVSAVLAVATIVSGLFGIIMTWFRLDDFQPSGLAANFIAVHTEWGLWLTFVVLGIAVIGAASTLLAPPARSRRRELSPVPYAASSDDDPFGFGI